MKAEKKGPLTPVEGGLMRIKSNVFRLNFFLSLLTDFFILAWAPSRVSADANESIAMKTVSLSSAKLNWGLSLTGKVLAQPLKTRDGYIAVCEGNTVVSFTQGGKHAEKSGRSFQTDTAECFTLYPGNAPCRCSGRMDLAHGHRMRDFQ